MDFMRRGEDNVVIEVSYPSVFWMRKMATLRLDMSAATTKSPWAAGA